MAWPDQDGKHKSPLFSPIHEALSARVCNVLQQLAALLQQMNEPNGS
jgi:hypothetical protein